MVTLAETEPETSRLDNAREWFGNALAEAVTGKPDGNVRVYALYVIVGLALVGATVTPVAVLVGVTALLLLALGERWGG